MENLLENFAQIKEKVVHYVEIAKKNEWIEEDEYNNILERIQNDVLTIGVIGQMKSGKSTFLNAFLFKDTVLPAASTPMTAALSVITYGEKEEVTADFYSPEEWEEIEQKALSDDDEPDVKASKELKEKSAALGNRLTVLLGKSQSADLSELINYVGADGKYTPITKFVTIKVNDQRLRGVRVVDTPGLNDPVVSREERTKDFLKEADVVILLLYAGRAFDETDREILFNKVKNVGVGKIIIGVNKYDLAIAEGELESDIRNYVRDAIAKELYKQNNLVLNQLLKNLEPILLSAYMALLATIPKEKIMADENLQWHYKKICDDFETNSTDKLFELSRLEKLEEEIDVVLSKDKMEILVRKPVNAIQARIDGKKKEFAVKTIQLTERKKDLARSDDELDERLRKFTRAKRRIERSIESKELDLNEFLDREISDTELKIKKKRNQDIDELHKIVDEEKKVAKIKTKIDSEVKNISASIEGYYRKLYDDIKHRFKDISDESIKDIDEIISDFIDDEDWSDKKKDLELKCRKELVKYDNFSFEDMFTRKDIDKKGGNYTVWRAVSDAAAAVLFGAIGLGIKLFIQSRLDNKKFKEDINKKVDELFPMDKIKDTFIPVREHAEEFIAFFRKTFLDDLLSPIIESIESIKTEEINKDQEKETIEKELLILKEKSEHIEKQLEELRLDIKTLLA